MSSQTVPLIAQPNQQFAVQLTVNGQALTVNLTLAYSAMAGYWQMAIADVNGNSLIANVPLITGLYPAANLLAQYEYMQIGEAYLLNTGSSLADYPGQYDLVQFSLLWSDNT
jgi:hypothetical protein